MKKPSLTKRIEAAIHQIGTTWPLYSFVTSNPLSGYEHKPFIEAIQQAGSLLGAQVLPAVSSFRRAYETGKIDPNRIQFLLCENGFMETPEYYLNLLESREVAYQQNDYHELDRITSKWLAAFMDEGLAEWSMPGKKSGFYIAWRSLAKYDREVKGISHRPIPATANEAINEVLGAYPELTQTEIIINHLAALPGWTGYIKHRNTSNTSWQQEFPITLEDYLGVRLWIAHTLKVPLLTSKAPKGKNSHTKIRYLWLQAWEATWQDELLKKLHDQPIEKNPPEGNSPEAQLVFCIDTRSEPIRRHLEALGNYETFGYAGFFGIAMDYQNPADGMIRKSCPPILNSAYQVLESPRKEKQAAYLKFQKKVQISDFREYFLKRMKNMLPSTFGFVEGTGLAYGIGLVLRTFLPARQYKKNRKSSLSYETICLPEIHRVQRSGNANVVEELPLAEQAKIVMSAFELTGWTHFAPLVVFVGHGSSSTNNPFGSSLDCGACAASPGRHNARMIARMANNQMVRNYLINEFDFIIPASTLFLAAEHNTTTDEILLFDEDVPASHRQSLIKLRTALFKAQKRTSLERLGPLGKSISAAETKAGDWAETRPEWGLAGNAGFVIGPRKLTKNSNLSGRCFLHSYNWEKDTEGRALESIMQGPMVVTQWINSHYYFASVDTYRFGSGSKITQNITGKFGVLQGNGGDLKFGLPLQSLQLSDTEAYHQPLRLSVLVQAPKERVCKILDNNESLKSLIVNGWIHLMVTDPLEGNKTYHYKDLEPIESDSSPVKNLQEITEQPEEVEISSISNAVNG